MPDKPAKHKLGEVLAVLSAIVELSDRVEAAGGTTCIAGIAAAHNMQKCIQKSRRRLIDLAKEWAAHA